jgi:fatty acid desaturase
MLYQCIKNKHNRILRIASLSLALMAYALYVLLRLSLLPSPEFFNVLMISCLLIFVATAILWHAMDLYPFYERIKRAKQAVDKESN